MKTVTILKYPLSESNLAKLIPHPGSNIMVYAEAMGKSGTDIVTFNHYAADFRPLNAIKEFLQDDAEYSITFAFPVKETPLKWIIALHSAGLKNIQWYEENGFVRHNIIGIFLLKLLQAFKSRIACVYCYSCTFFKAAYGVLDKILLRMGISIPRVFSPSFLKISSQLDYLIEMQGKDISGLTREEIKIMNFIGTLGAGGAERQLCNFVIGIKNKGYSNSRVLTYCPLDDNNSYNAHYLPRLKNANIDVSSIDLLAPYEPVPELEYIPALLRKEVKAVYDKIIADPPDIFHAWLDYTNIIGAFAALLAGVPRIILSTRNVSPYHFPYLHKKWFKPCYQFLAKSPRVHFINNSTNGGKDYAKWLKLPVENFHIVLNGVDFDEMKKPSEEQIREFRKSLDIEDDAIVVSGIFRLSPEKCPYLFFDIAEKILKQYKNVYFIHAGEGPLKKALEKKICEKQLPSKFKLLGRRNDVPVMLSASDIFLLTSENEGTPNVILEAEWFGCCPVSTAAGGVPDCIDHGKTGFVHAVNDKAALIKSVSMLVEDDSLRKRISEAAPEFIKERFNLEKMLSKTLELYK